MSQNSSPSRRDIVAYADYVRRTTCLRLYYRILKYPAGQRRAWWVPNDETCHWMIALVQVDPKPSPQAIGKHVDIILRDWSVHTACHMLSNTTRRRFLRRPGGPQEYDQQFFLLNFLSTFPASLSEPVPYARIPSGALLSTPMQMSTITPIADPFCRIWCVHEGLNGLR